MSSVLRLENINKIYNEHENSLTVLNDVNFTLNASEMVALVAPSGCGKSTLLHITGLLEKPTSGNLYLYNEKISDLSNTMRTNIRGKEIGFVYQSHNLLPEFSALENVMMPLLIAKKNYSLARDRAFKLLKYLNIEDKADNRPREMSGGQQQRVAIARAVANAPSILLADEPTGNLDPKTAQKVFNVFSHLVKRAGISTIIATHNYSLAQKMDRIITIEAGKIVEIK